MMLNMIQSWAAGVLFAATLAGVPAASVAQENSLERIREAGVIRVALEFGRPPWGFKDQDLTMSGYDMDVAAALAQDLGVQLQIVEVIGPNRVPFLMSNFADVVISTFAITPERAEVVDFSVPYASLMAAVAAPASIEITDGTDLADKRVGVTRASTSDLYLTEQAPDAEITRFDDDATTNTAFLSGQVEIVAGEPIMLMGLMSARPEVQLEQKFILKETYAAVGLRKNEPELKAWVDEWVRANLRNGRLGGYFNKYFGHGLSETVLAGATG